MLVVAVRHRAAHAARARLARAHALFLGVADGSLSASPVAPHRYRRRLGLGITGTRARRARFSDRLGASTQPKRRTPRHAVLGSVCARVRSQRHNCISHNYIGHNYAGRNYTRLFTMPAHIGNALGRRRRRNGAAAASVPAGRAPPRPERGSILAGWTSP